LRAYLKLLPSKLLIYQAKTLDLCAHSFADEIFFVICARFEDRELAFVLERCSSG
jgi:hypothetical protein